MYSRDNSNMSPCNTCTQTHKLSAHRLHWHSRPHPCENIWNKIIDRILYKWLCNMPPVKYAQYFTSLVLSWLYLAFLHDLFDLFTHIFQGYVTGTRAITHFLTPWESSITLLLLDRYITESWSAFQMKCILYPIICIHNEILIMVQPIIYTLKNRSYLIN